MADRAIAVKIDGYTENVYRTCGFDHCLTEGVKSLGVSEPDALALVLDKSQRYAMKADGYVVIELVEPGECDYDTWCAWCGDFLSHGLNCTCPDMDKDREPQVVGDLQR